MSLRVGVHLIRRRILRRADRAGGQAAHSSVFRCWSGFEAISVLSGGSRSRFEIWDEVEPADDFLARCDVLVGIPDIRLLNARQRSRHRPPYLAMVMGDATRAIPWPPPVMERLQANDTLVCTCAADIEILRMFLRTPSSSSLDIAPMPGDLLRFGQRRPFPAGGPDPLRELDPARPVILSAERLHPAKGVHRVIPFVAHLRDCGHRPVLVFLGARASNAAYQQSMEAQLRDAGLVESTVWLPFLGQDDLAAMYARSSFIVSASTIYDNNFGYVPIESMAAGTPPVVTDWGGYRESVLDGVTGAHMTTTLHADGSVTVDVLPAARAATAMLADPGEYERAAAAGRERVATTFSVQATMRRYAALAEAALGRREDALRPWAASELGRRAVAAGWTDQTDNPERTRRIPRRTSDRSRAGRLARSPEQDVIHQLIYAKYATRVEGQAPTAPRGGPVFPGARDAT